MMSQQDQQLQSKLFYELSSLILNILRSPPVPTTDFSDETPIISLLATGGSSSSDDAFVEQRQMRRRENRDTLQQQITPIGFASLLLGISVVLMLSGSVTFFIGFMLMPWVIGLSMVLCVVGFVSSLSMIGRSILYPTSSPSSSLRKNYSSAGKAFSNQITGR